MVYWLCGCRYHFRSLPDSSGGRYAALFLPRPGAAMAILARYNMHVLVIIVLSILACMGLPLSYGQSYTRFHNLVRTSQPEQEPRLGYDVRPNGSAKCDQRIRRAFVDVFSSRSKSPKCKPSPVLSDWESENASWLVAGSCSSFRNCLESSTFMLRRDCI
jgi:hypothetical protein